MAGHDGTLIKTTGDGWVYELGQMLVFGPRGAELGDSVQGCARDLRERLGMKVALVILVGDYTPRAVTGLKRSVDDAFMAMRDDLSCGLVLVQSRGFVASVFLSVGSRIMAAGSDGVPRSVFGDSMKATEFLNANANADAEALEAEWLEQQLAAIRDEMLVLNVEASAAGRRRSRSDIG